MSVTARSGEGAAAGVMAALAWVPRIVLAHLAWLGLTLLGGVVLGAAPATVTVLAALHEDPVPGGARQRAAALLGRFRAEFVPANAAVGPFWFIAAAAGLNLLAAIAGWAPTWFVPVGAAVAAVLGAVTLLAGLHAASLRVLMPTAPLPVLWRAAAAGPFVLPLATAAWSVTALALAGITVAVPALTLACGAGVLCTVTWLLLVRVWRERLRDAGWAEAPGEGAG